ncbi:hypothetical protein [Paraglaciecola sp.]|uniref:hypothetical protein n=1 Tax=Paraglaciecola sp. TaxID=1920173 RepID=UPI003EF3F980
MVKNKIEKSVVADRGAKIKNVDMSENKTIKRMVNKDSILGFIFGVLTSVIGSYVYEFLKQ